MSILVTGGTGITGSNIARLLVEQGRDVVVLARRSFESDPTNPLRDVPGKYKIATGNITDLAFILDVVKKHKVEGIIHLAGMLATEGAQHPIELLNVNIIGSANMLEAARIMGLRRVILTSSSVLYGPSDDIKTPRKEEEITIPTAGMYATSKIAIEFLTYTYRQAYGVDTVALRPHALYGPGNWGPHMLQPTYQMVWNAVNGKPIVHDSGGESVSELTYVKDYARGNIQAYDCPGKLPYHVYNLGCGQNRNMFEVAEILKGLFPKLTIKLGPGLWAGALAKADQKEATHRIAQRPPEDNSRARHDFGYNPEWPIERGIPDWVRWIKGGKYTAD